VDAAHSKTDYSSVLDVVSGCVEDETAFECKSTKLFRYYLLTSKKKHTFARRMSRLPTK
jgi:hypothetical protein